MAIKPCRSCGGLDGAHFAFCFGARLFERVMGKSFPLFPPGAFTSKSIDLTGLLDVMQTDGTLSQAQQAARSAGAELDVTLVPDKAEEDTEREEHATTVQGLREALRREHEQRLAQRATTEALTREVAELRALLDAATAPEKPSLLDELPDIDVELREEDRPGEAEPWWWNSPLGREARASVALDGETHVVGQPDPMPTVEELASVPDEPAPVDAPVAGLDEAEVEALEEAAAEVAAVEDAADQGEIQQFEDQFAEATQRKAWMDDKRVELRNLINGTEGLSQKALADGTGINQGTVSSILNGKVYGPRSKEQLERMLSVAANFAPSSVSTRRSAPPPGSGSIDMVKQGAAWRSVERFLGEASERVEEEFTTAPDLQAAYDLWREATGSPMAHPIILGQVAVAAGYARMRKNVNGKQVRAYGGLRLRELTHVTRQGGGDEAPQDSDGEPVALAPATPARELLHPDAERYTRDEVPGLFEEIARQGRSVKGVMSAYLAQEMGPSRTGTVLPPDPATFMAPPLPIEHPAGWDTLPGKELRDGELRGMAVKLVKEQGWGYKRSHGRGGKPKLRSPDGHTFTLPNTPGDYRSVKNTRAGLRRLGADL